MMNFDVAEERKSIRHSNFLFSVIFRLSEKHGEFTHFKPYESIAYIRTSKGVSDDKHLFREPDAMLLLSSGLMSPGLSFLVGNKIFSKKLSLSRKNFLLLSGSIFSN